MKDGKVERWYECFQELLSVLGDYPEEQKADAIAMAADILKQMQSMTEEEKQRFVASYGGAE